jgi:hypothetical protein
VSSYSKCIICAKVPRQRAPPSPDRALVAWGLDPPLLYTYSFNIFPSVQKKSLAFFIIDLYYLKGLKYHYTRPLHNKMHTAVTHKVREVKVKN